MLYMMYAFPEINDGFTYLLVQVGVLMLVLVLSWAFHAKPAV